MKTVRALLIFLSIFIFFQNAAGGINVIHPKPDSQLPPVDSTFIFGSTIPGDDLYINGQRVEVHEGGGFLGFIDIHEGDFVFELVSINDGDTSRFQLPVKVGYDMELLPIDSLYFKIGSVLPQVDMELPSDEIIELGFNAAPGCSAFYMNPIDSTWNPLYEMTLFDKNSGSVFGEIAPESTSALSYYYKYNEAGLLCDTGWTGIDYRIIKNDTDTVVFCSAGKIRRLDNEIRIVEFTGEAEIVRTAPEAGYLLLYQPSGVRAVYDGFEGGFTRIRLSSTITGFVPTDSVTLLPPGTRIPSSRIRFVKIEERDRDIEVRIPLNRPLPYEIREELHPSGLTVFLYGAIGDTDWIKHIPAGDAVLFSRWFAPEDGVFALNIKLRDGYLWGYTPFYDGNDFVLKIRKKPKERTELKDLRIAVDPGHCPDDGAVGPTGLRERDVNLWIAHELAQILKDKGADVIMTRYGHEPVDLYQRTDIAVAHDADILISVHNNAFPDGVNPFVNNGPSTYYYHLHSRPLSEAIQRRLVDKTGLSDFGVYYGNLALTRPYDMIAVLVECAFIMIPEQEAMLKDREFRHKCAEAIYRGIEDFLKETNDR